MKCRVCRGSGAHAQLTTFFVVMLIPLSLLIALAVDLGGALAYRTWQGSLLESTRQSCFGEANAVKYADNPGEEARSEVLEMLRANGYTGKATVYYVEAPESLCGAADRYAGVYVVLEGTWPSTFARFAGIDELKVRSDAVWTLHPYSSTTVWRSADTGNGWCEYTIDKDGNVSANTGVCSLDDAPESLSKAVRDMLPASTGGADQAGETTPDGTE